MTFDSDGAAEASKKVRLPLWGRIRHSIGERARAASVRLICRRSIA